MRMKKFGTKIAPYNEGGKWKNDEFAQNLPTSSYYAKDVEPPRLHPEVRYVT